MSAAVAAAVGDQPLLEELALLADPGPRPREVPQFLGLLHRVLGPENPPLIERFARGGDWRLLIAAARYPAP